MYDERILREFPHAFQNKEKIGVLVRAFARQLDGLYQAGMDLKTLCDLDTAQGKQLDGIGDIVVLSRSDAMRLIKGPIQYDIMDDEHYRHYLKYKILKNTSTCTYYDIITAVQMLWGADEIEYFEDPEEPAAVTLAFPDPGGAAQLDDIPPIIAAGVGIHIHAKSLIHVAQRIFAGSCVGVHDTQLIRPHQFGRHIQRRVFAGAATVLHEDMEVRPFSRQRSRAIKTRAFAGSRLAVTESLHVAGRDVPKTAALAPPFFIGRHLGIHETITIRPWKKEMMTVDF